MKFSKFIKFEAIVFAIMAFVFVVCQITCWAWWLWEWGDRGQMPNVASNALRFTGISIITTAVAFVIGTLAASVNSIEETEQHASSEWR